MWFVQGSRGSSCLCGIATILWWVVIRVVIAVFNSMVLAGVVFRSWMVVMILWRLTIGMVRLMGGRRVGVERRCRSWRWRRVGVKRRWRPWRRWRWWSECVRSHGSLHC